MSIPKRDVGEAAALLRKNTETAIAAMMTWPELLSHVTFFIDLENGPEAFVYAWNLSQDEKQAIARKFKHLGWKRRVSPCNRDQIDWQTEVCGVLVRLEAAESIRRTPILLPDVVEFPLQSDEADELAFGRGRKDVANE